MAKRSIEQKARKRVARLIRKEQNALPVFIDPVAWLVNNGHAGTKPEAKRLIRSGRLTDGEQTIGLSYALDGNRVVQVVSDRVSADLEGRLQVVEPEA